MARNLLDLLGMLGGQDYDKRGGYVPPWERPEYLRKRISVRGLDPVQEPEVEAAKIKALQAALNSPDLKQQQVPQGTEQVPQEPVRTGPSAEVLGRILMDKERMFAPDQEEERPLVRRHLGLLPVTGDPFREGYFPPKFTPFVRRHPEDLPVGEGLSEAEKEEIRETPFFRGRAGLDIAEHIPSETLGALNKLFGGTGRAAEELVTGGDPISGFARGTGERVPVLGPLKDLMRSAETKYAKTDLLTKALALTPSLGLGQALAVSRTALQDVPGRKEQFPPTDEPISVPTPEVPAPDIPTKTEPSGEEKVDVKSTNLPGMGDPTYQKWVKDSERLGITLSDHVRNEIAREMGLEKSDINEKISQLSQRLLEALDRKPGWPEILMAWGLMLMGQDGVGFVQQINQSRLGQVSALQTALQGARTELGRREALGAADQQAQMTRATALQKEKFGRREKTLSNLIAATGRTSAEFSKYLRAHADFGGTKLKALLGYPGTAKERMDLTHIRKMAEMAQMLLTEYPAWATTLSLSQLLEAAKAKLKEQPIEVTG